MTLRAAVPADIEEIAAALHAVTRRADELFSNLPPGVLEQAPRPGKWSAAQCLAHITATNATYIAAIRNAVKPSLHLRHHQRTGPVSIGFPTRWFLALLEPPARTRFRAPKKIAPPASIDAFTALREFRRSQNSVIELLTECRHLDMNRIRFSNSILPGCRFTVGAGFVIIAAHGRRHLWQAENVATSKQWFAAAG